MRVRELEAKKRRASEHKRKITEFIAVVKKELMPLDIGVLDFEDSVQKLKVQVDEQKEELDKQDYEMHTRTSSLRQLEVEVAFAELEHKEEVAFAETLISQMEEHAQKLAGESLAQQRKSDEGRRFPKQRRPIGTLVQVRSKIFQGADYYDISDVTDWESHLPTSIESTYGDDWRRLSGEDIVHIEDRHIERTRRQWPPRAAQPALAERTKLKAEAANPQDMGQGTLDIFLTAAVRVEPAGHTGAESETLLSEHGGDAPRFPAGGNLATFHEVEWMLHRT